MPDDGSAAEAPGASGDEARLVADLQAHAKRGGHDLSEGDARRLLVGVGRMRRMADAVRRHVVPDLEPTDPADRARTAPGPGR